MDIGEHRAGSTSGCLEGDPHLNELAHKCEGNPVRDCLEGLTTKVRFSVSCTGLYYDLGAGRLVRVRLGRALDLRFAYQQQKTVLHLLNRYGGRQLKQVYGAEVVWRVWLPRSQWREFAAAAVEASGGGVQVTCLPGVEPRVADAPPTDDADVSPDS